MKKTNVINSSSNLNILREISNNLPTVEFVYKGNYAPCVVFEDDSGEVYYVAHSTEEYLENRTKLPKTLLEIKNDLITSVNKKATWAYNLLDIKYAWTHKRGVSDKVASEYYAFLKDPEAPTPVIDQYTKQKGRSNKEEQIERIGRIINFEVDAAILIEKLIGGIQDATDLQTLSFMEAEIKKLDEIETIDGFIELINTQE